MLLRLKSFCWFVTLVSSLNTFGSGEKKVVDPGNLVRNLQPTIPEIKSYAKIQIRLEDIADESYLYKANNTQIIGELMNLHQNARDILDKCEKFHRPLMCNNSFYRSYDGSCNNLVHPEWGKAIIEQARLLPASYEGVRGLRKAVSGQDLPSPRYVSLQCGDQSHPSDTVSALFTFFGQFITHDVLQTPVMSDDEEGCRCGTKGRTDTSCAAAVDYPEDDPFYSPINITCQIFIRATPFPKCNFDKRGIINLKTSFIDASNVYDNSDNASYRLRTNDGTGTLRTQDTLFGDLMPKNQNVKDVFCPRKSTSECFKGGDDRVNQHLMLTSLQTIFVRLHNRIATHLGQLNPHWDDERIFQEARRISIAIYQLITYREYLPLLVGPDVMKNYDLNVNLSESTLYNDEVDPTVTVEFSAAAFRVHSMISSSVSSHMPLLKLRDSYSYFRPLHWGHLDPLLAGSSEVPSERNDAFQVQDVSHFTYKPPGATFGSDLTSTDLQRGRDAGSPPYVDMVRMCSSGKEQLSDFGDLRRLDLMEEAGIRELQGIYEDVRDVDSISGMNREVPVQHGEVGPTAACINAIQFSRLKFGDSFFITHRNGRHPFTRDQLEELEHWSLARLLCETTRLTEIRREPLTLPTTRNPLVQCKSFQPMNFTAWKELF